MVKSRREYFEMSVSTKKKDELFTLYKESQDELYEALRQGGRCLIGNPKSIRIMHQKMNAIREKRDELNRNYYTYHEKTNVESSSDIVMNTGMLEELQNWLDKAVDMLDEFTVLIEDMEQKKIDGEDNAANTLRDDAEKRKLDFDYQQCLTGVTIDNRVGRNIIIKIQAILNENDASSENGLILKTHLNELTGVHESLQKLWLVSICRR